MDYALFIIILLQTVVALHYKYKEFLAKQDLKDLEFLYNELTLKYKTQQSKIKAIAQRYNKKEL